jgi:paraquat-inducible protein B
MFEKLKTALTDVSFTCQINNKTFEHDISIESENKKVKPTNRNTTNTSVTIEEALKEEFVIIHRKDLIELQKSKHILKDLLGTIENLNNKLKTLSNDIRTISES